MIFVTRRQSAERVFRHSVVTAGQQVRELSLIFQKLLNHSLVYNRPISQILRKYCTYACFMLSPSDSVFGMSVLHVCSSVCPFVLPDRSCYHEKKESLRYGTIYLRASICRVVIRYGRLTCAQKLTGWPA